MPVLVRLYIRNVAIGFLLSAVFVGALLWLDVAHLWHLVSTSPVGGIAVVMLVVFNGIVFAGVQFAIAVMRLAEDDGPRGGHRQRRAAGPALPVTVAAQGRQRARRAAG
ncbi:hypothetical protein, partial [Albidovulum sp.]